MTVGELRKAMWGIPHDTPVHVNCGGILKGQVNAVELCDQEDAKTKHPDLADYSREYLGKEWLELETTFD